MQDVDAVDLVDLFDAVLEVEGRRVVDGHLELGECAEDLHLKVMTGHEGERRQKIPLLLPPAFSQFVVADQNRFPALTEARVDVESDVVPAQEVDREHLGVWFNLSSDGQHQLVVDAAGEIHVERNRYRSDGWCRGPLLRRSSCGPLTGPTRLTGITVPCRRDWRGQVTRRGG